MQHVSRPQHIATHRTSQTQLDDAAVMSPRTRITCASARVTKQCALAKRLITLTAQTEPPRRCGEGVPTSMFAILIDSAHRQKRDLRAPCPLRSAPFDHDCARIGSKQRQPPTPDARTQLYKKCGNQIWCKKCTATQRDTRALVWERANERSKNRSEWQRGRE